MREPHIALLQNTIFQAVIQKHSHNLHTKIENYLVNLSYIVYVLNAHCTNYLSLSFFLSVFAYAIFTFDVGENSLMP